MKIIVILCWFILICLGCSEFDSPRTIVNAIGDFPEGLDPAINSGITESRIIFNVYESLVQLHTDHQSIKEKLAYSWQKTDNDLTYQFFLTDGIQFHDGSPLTAQAVAFSFQRQILHNSDSPLFNMIEQVTAVDSFTLEIRLKYVYQPFMYSLTASTGLKAISQRALESYGDDIGRHPCGTGPMKLKEWKEKEYILIQPFLQNSTHQPEIDAVKFKYYHDYFEGEKSLREGESEILAAIAGYSIDRLKWQGIINYAVGQSFSTVFLGFNTSDKILSDEKVRRAILSSVDIPDLVHNVLRGNSLVANGPLPPVFNIGQTLSQEKYDPENARRLMKEAGYNRPMKLRFFYLDLYRARNTAFEMIERSLEKIGIELDRVPFYSWESLNAACRSDSAQLSWMVWEADMLGDPENFLYSLFHSQSPYNFFQYQCDQVDSLLHLARQQATREGRNLRYRKIVDQVLLDSPAIFLYHPIPTYAYNQKKIDFLPINPYNIIDYHLIKLKQ